jgi:exosortase
MTETSFSPDFAPPAAAAPPRAQKALKARRQPILRALRSDRWTAWHGVAALVMAALGVWATREAWSDIFHIAANDDEYSHVFLVPVVMAWMVWVRRMRFRHCKPSATLIGPLVAAAGWGISLYGFYNGHQSLWHGGSVLVVLGCVLAVLGKHALFSFFPAVAVLVFLIPVPGVIRHRIALPLQEWTAQLAHTLMQILGAEVERWGNMLVVNNERVTIAEACNGVRGVFALVLVGYAFSFGLPLRNSVRILILLASPAVTIFCNVLRILPTAWLYGYHSERVGNLFHDVAGWLMLPLAFLLLLGILKVVRWATVPVMKYTLAA